MPTVELKEQEMLVKAWGLLKTLAESEVPVIRYNCRRALNEVWQAVFELDLLDLAGAGPD